MIRALALAAALIAASGAAGAEETGFKGECVTVADGQFKGDYT